MAGFSVYKKARPEIPGGLFLFYRAPHCFNLAAAIL